MKSQRNAQGIALHLLSGGPSPLFFISTIIISCYATLPLMSFFQSFFVAIIFLHFCLSPYFIVTAHLLSSLSLCQTQYYVVHVFSPCHLAYLYMVFDFSCIVYSSIQPPTKCLFPQLFLCLCILTFLHLVVASFVLFSSSSPYALFSAHW